MVNPGGQFASYVFRGNSLFDPDFTGTGHQPYGFDQWNNFYERYTVVGCSIRVQAFTNTSVPANAGSITLLPSASDTPPSASMQTYNEDPRYRTRMATVTDSGGGRTFNSIKGYSKTSTVFGIPKSQINTEDFSADFTAGPAREWYWHILYSAMSGGVTPIPMLRVSITYYVMFDQIKPALTIS